MGIFKLLTSRNTNNSSKFIPHKLALKKITTSALLFVSYTLVTNAAAHSTYKQYINNTTNNTNDTSNKIINLAPITLHSPTFSNTNLPISDSSDPNGVCASLGLGTYVKDSLRKQLITNYVKATKPAIKINRNGMAEKQVQITHAVSRISCKQPQDATSRPKQWAVIISRPLFLPTNAVADNVVIPRNEGKLFSSLTSEDTVCKSLNFAAAVPNSAVVSSDPGLIGHNRHGIILDKTMQHVELMSKLTRPVLRVICVNTYDS